MTRRQCASTVAVLAVVLGVALLVPISRAEERRPAVLGQSKLTAKSIELFQAIDDGLIEVKVIPRNDEVARVMITNKTGEPLSVELPEAFGLVPAAAQCCAVAACCCGNSAQPAGGGLNAGLFNVPAEAVRTIRTPIVCLAHGKRDPRPSVPYVLVALESVCDAPELSTILGLLAKEQVDHAAAQAAAWHLVNAMSWQTLAAKEIRHLNGTREPYFTDEQIRQARTLTERAKRQLAARDQRAPSVESEALAETTRDNP